VPVSAKIRALSNETRFEIVKLVRDREMDAGTAARHFKLTRQAVSQHRGVLREAGLLASESDRSDFISRGRKPSMSLSSSSKAVGGPDCDD